MSNMVKVSIPEPHSCHNWYGVDLAHNSPTSCPFCVSNHSEKCEWCSLSGVILFDEGIFNDDSLVDTEGHNYFEYRPDDCLAQKAYLRKNWLRFLINGIRFEMVKRRNERRDARS